MTSRFGMFGDLDILVSQIRQKVSNNVAVLANVRQSLKDGAIAKGWITEARLAEIVAGVERDLDLLVNRDK